jgi:anaerobic magnesium-protoporphyrin IX monomethyl ester cyclase
MKKILFITPPYHCGVVEVAGSWMPLSFVYLAGAAREAGLKAVIYDAMTKNHGYAQIEARLKEEAPDYVATTAYTSTINDAIKVLALAKKINPQTTTLIGGVHPTFMAQEVIDTIPGAVDFVVRGEGEITLKQFLKAHLADHNLEDIPGLTFRQNGNILATPPREFMTSLDNLPQAWDLIEWPDYRYFVIPRSRLGAISTSRGCNHDCTFCSQQKFWQQSWRGRCPQACVADIEHLSSQYGVNVVLIADEYPTKERERWERFLDLLIEHRNQVYLLMETRVEDIVRDKDILWKYRKAGIIHIYIGVESTDQATLDLIKKDLKVEQSQEAIQLIHQHGMITETSFVLGLPQETKSSVKRTLKLAKLYNPDFAHFLAIAPWPYADMYKDLQPYIEVYDYSKYNLVEPVVKPKRMTLSQIDQAIIDCYRKFYMEKLKELLNLQDEFKKKYLLTSMKVMMNSSFLTQKLGSLGKIPAKVEKYLRKLQGG